MHIRHSKKTAFIPLKHTKIPLMCPFLHRFSAFLKIYGSLETACFQPLQKPGTLFVFRAGLWWRWRESNSRPKAFPQDFLRAQLMILNFASVTAH